MSLSFVSSAVQTGTSDGGFEEVPIESKEIEALNKRNAHKPLFEQLRTNNEDDQAKKDEMEREIMRATCALDDEDVAHLDSINKQRTERERTIQERTQTEVNTFRAAKALRQQAALSVGDVIENDNDNHDNGNDNNKQEILDSTWTEQKARPSAPNHNRTMIPLLVPVIKVKKRKRRAIIDNNGTKPTTATGMNNVSNKKLTKPDSDSLDTEKKKNIKMLQLLSSTKKDSNSGGGLDSLLSGYGSSSDED